MINTNKFLSRNSTPTLSTRSILGLGIIRSDSKKIDNLLKERLVLSKVRYGIERQRLERERRRNRETSLENDAEQNYEISDFSKDNSKRRDGKPKRGLGFFMGTVLRTVVSSIGGLAFAAIPRFNLINDKVIKSGTNFNKTIGGTDGLLNSIKSHRGPFDKLRKIDLKPIRNIGKTITGFGNSLQFFVTSAIAGQVGGRAISSLRTTSQVKAQVAQSAKARQKITSKVIARETVIVKEVAKQRAKKRSVSVEEGVKNPIRKVKTPVRETVTAGRKIRDQEKFLEELGLDPNLRKFGTEVPGAAKTRPIPLNKGIYGSPEVDQFFNEITNNKKFNNNPALRTKVDNDFQLFLNARNPSVKRRRLSQLLNSLKSGGVSTLNINRLSTILTFSAFKPIDPTSIRKPANQIFGAFGVKGGQIGPKTAADFRFSQRFGKATATGADPFTGAPTYQVGSRGRDVDPVTGMFRAKRAVVTRKGLSKLLFNAGGEALEQSVKQTIKASVGVVPIIGDLIGFLLDVFLFGQPVGRAAFMALGSFVGSLIGGVFGLIGGPPGALVGGILGGIGGDLLGGAFYDLIFRDNAVGRIADNISQSFVKKGVKTGIGAGFMRGGYVRFGGIVHAGEFVIDSDSTRAIERQAPGFLSALNKAKGSQVNQVLETYMSYGGGEGEGSETLIPLPFEKVVTKTIVAGGESRDTGDFTSPFMDLYRRG